MKFRMGAALAAAAALAACNNSGSKNEAGANNSASANASGTAASTAPANPNPADATIVADVSQAAEIIRAQLPMKQGNGVTFTDVEARGSELILEMTLENDLNQAQFSQLQQQLPTLACNNPQARETFRRGGTYTYRVVDSGGETFNASVNRCAS